MKTVINFLSPKHVLSLLKMMLTSLILLQCCRLIFFISNYSFFDQISVMDFLVGTWFDLMTIGIVYIPFYILYLFPFPYSWRKTPLFKTLFKVFFYVINLTLLLPNLIDVAYFKFTLKRSTADLVDLIGTGDDVKNLIPSFAKDFWYLLIIFLVLLFITEVLYKKWITATAQSEKGVKNPRWWHSTILLLSYTTLFFIMGRGGLQLKPTGIISASQFTKPENTSLVLNSTFSIIKTWNKPYLKKIKYFQENKELFRYFKPYSNYGANYNLQNSNVIILVLESFTQEAIGVYNQEQSFTPFLDSLLSHSMVLKNVYANGKKSIEAIPAITAGIPSLMDHPFISSPYSNNQFVTLTDILNQEGYHTSFFHGATNGSMNFDGYAAWAGYNDYFGRSEYDNEEHFDGSWGIYDEYFLPWAAKKMDKFQQPFFSTVFTISSHHPYKIPRKHHQQFNKYSEPIWNSIAYADYCLRLFFKELNKYDWFNNTLFVITADHTPVGENEYYKKRTGMYAIPLAFYHPSVTISGNTERTSQQTDIPSSIIDLLNLNIPYYSFGKSVFSPEKGFSISYLQGIYNYYSGDYALLFDGENHAVHGLYDTRVDSMLGVNIYENHNELGDSLVNELKAIIQTYNNDMIDNQMKVRKLD